ncbi:hypothetical protein ACLKA6_007305 [Drosophila palustris]
MGLESPIEIIHPEPAEQQQHQAPARSTTNSSPSTPLQPQMPTESSVVGLTQVAPDLTCNVDQSATPKPLASRTSEASQDYFNDVEARRDPEAQQSASANDQKRGEHHDQSPRPRTSEHSASCSNPSKDPERKAHQWLWVPVLRDSHMQVDGGNNDWLDWHLRIRKRVNWRIQRHCRRPEVRTPKTKFGQVQGADDPRLVEYSNTDPDVEALYRPRAGGGEKDRSACRNLTEGTHPVHEFESPMRIFNIADSSKSDPMASIWDKRIIARLTQSMQLRLLISGRGRWPTLAPTDSGSSPTSPPSPAATKFGQVQGADDPRLVEYSNTDPDVEALYRPRAGGGEKDRSACRNLTEGTHPVHEFESPMRIFNIADSSKSDPMASIWDKRIIARLTLSIKLRLLISGRGRWPTLAPTDSGSSPTSPPSPAAVWCYEMIIISYIDTCVFWSEEHTIERSRTAC